MQSMGTTTKKTRSSEYLPEKLISKMISTHNNKKLESIEMQSIVNETRRWRGGVKKSGGFELSHYR